MAQPKLTGAEDNLQALTVVAGGNPGALNALMQVVQHAQDELTALQVIYTADAMGMRGYLFYLAWNDWAHDDVQKLIAAIQQRDQELITFINEHPETKYHGDSVESDL